MTQAPSQHLDIDAPETSALETQELNLPEAVDTGARKPGGKFDILMETNVDIIAHLGETRMAARDVLELGPGAVVTLDRCAGEPVDLILNGVRFATGHLVVVGNQLGIRVKDILAPAQPGGEG